MHTTKASDQWSYCQAKGIKALIVAKDNKDESERYKKEAEHATAAFVTRHEHFALSAIAALIRQRKLWLVSLAAGVMGVILLIYGALH